MDQNVLQQLKVVNQLRRLNKAGEEMTWVNLLEYMGKGRTSGILPFFFNFSDFCATSSFETLNSQFHLKIPYSKRTSKDKVPAKNEMMLIKSSTKIF